MPYAERTCWWLRLLPYAKFDDEASGLFDPGENDVPVRADAELVQRIRDEAQDGIGVRRESRHHDEEELGSRVRPFAFLGSEGHRVLFGAVGRLQLIEPIESVDGVGSHAVLVPQIAQPLRFLGAEL